MQGTGAKPSSANINEATRKSKVEAEPPNPKIDSIEQGSKSKAAVKKDASKCMESQLQVCIHFSLVTFDAYLCPKLR